ncbi:hypothetical protein [Wielerella bovis]|uniref:hypothetical protein n=2 Tax=Wielerella bovis TaxID=2917790 RepID=UPI00201949D2|nr:hypothetical protein [Wielerella bovis]ULJ66842.1 hypothetical protein MIS31_11520 [Wielerella bovis]
MKMLEPTHLRQTTRVKTWDSKSGTAQAEDGGIYEINMARHRQRRNPQNPIFPPKLFAHHT